jgi:hypothetical protein
MVVLGWGTIVGVIFTVGAIGAPRAWSALRGRKKRWRIEEIRCNKCSNHPEPGYLTYTSLDPMTGEEHSATFPCDRCDKTGYIRVVIVDDDVKPSEWNEVRAQIEAGVDAEEIHTIRRESEVME